jgi:large subunit ribosomal protein L10
MAKAERQAAVEEITAQFRESNAAVLTEYRGLTVKQLKELRRSLGADTQYAVVKNTLTQRAAHAAGLEGLDDLLAGPSAIAFIKGDAVEAAKGLRDFAKANPLLVIKGGVMDGKSLSADEVTKLADLESVAGQRRRAVPGPADAVRPHRGRPARQGRAERRRRRRVSCVVPPWVADPHA